MASSNFTSFAPYAPPPDEQINTSERASSSRFNRPWFPVQASYSDPTQSYQSGGVPVVETSATTGFGSDDIAAVGEGGPSNLWETRFGYRVDALAAFAYILGPVSAFLLLAFESHNEYVRFHAYQSALFITPLLLLRIAASIFWFPAFFQILINLAILVSCVFMAYQAFNDAARNGLSRYHLPFVGDLAEQWLRDE